MWDAREAVCQAVGDSSIHQNAQIEPAQFVVQVTHAADMLSDIGWPEEALKLHRCLLNLSVLTGRQVLVVYCHNSIGCTLKKLDMHDESLVELQTALDMELAILGECHPAGSTIIKTTQNNIAANLGALGMRKH